MAAVLVLILLLLAVPFPPARTYADRGGLSSGGTYTDQGGLHSSNYTRRGDVVYLGYSLSPTNSTSWRSPSSRFALGFYKQGPGFQIGIWLATSPKPTVVWTANRDDAPVSSNASLLLTEDGLLLRSEGAKEKLITVSQQIKPVSGFSCSYAVMFDSGNFVLYDSRNQSIWESFAHPTDTILAGQTLPSTHELFSSVSEDEHSTGRFRLAMQADSNLVQYPINTTDLGVDAYWSSETNGFEPLDLHLYEDGSVVLINSTGGNRSFLGEPEDPMNAHRTFIHRATLDPDGIFRLYSHSWDPVSLTAKDLAYLSNPCKAKGFCGFNSYCTLVGDQPNCFCLPGYVFSDPLRWFDGCQRNFSLKGCDNTDDNNNNTGSISVVENLVFGSQPYDTVPTTDRDGCKEGCLKDCDCEAALHRDDSCQKFNMPLRYGSQMQDSHSTITAFIKVGGTGGTTTNEHHDSRGREEQHDVPLIFIILAVCLVIVFAILSSGVVFFLKMKSRGRRDPRGADDHTLGLLDEIVLRSFSYSELIQATDNFKEELGKGGFGTVYKGFLSSGQTNALVAVKRLEKVVEEGEREFRAEMRAIGRVYHKNLVRLLGFCDEGAARLLVYEYMGNGSLATLLFKSKTRPKWSERARLALDVARGISYLHEDCDPHIIHCDIKPQNILLDDSWTAKISDFGLAKLLMPDQTRTVTMVRGTRGYLAPEWNKNAPISVKSDVYSFGILLLEIVCCRRNIEAQVAADEEVILSEWVGKCFVGGELQKLVGDEEVEMRLLDRMVRVALSCIQEEPALRPSMKNVILMMGGNMHVPVPAAAALVPSLY